MNVKFCRIDDRLIHGQVVTTWVNVHGIEQIIILNKEVAEDQVQSSVLKMTAPANVKLAIFSPEKFLEIIQKNPINRATMLLFSSVYDVEKIVNGGFKMEKLNVGGMRLNPEREQLTKAVSVTEDERKVFKKLLANGIDINIQMVPNDSPIKLKELV
ncbi:PTS mannose/fructose/sorbose transporter subunit IIB [Vagococcus elongatus]|uniref:PTS mannose/fructose/sorbose transporter subunit IIB n=2 Tax=Vagococcus elongatus TaxID=180344 RepID=A0A430AZU8_9ENTE|nr:PTS mannose/fructose/sorbose transporter subunit IIB [Vagococcus elongatus]